MYLSACLLASGLSLIDIVRENHNICTFVFNVPPETAKDIIRRHWNYELLLPTRNLMDAIHELKTRIYGSE